MSASSGYAEQPVEAFPLTPAELRGLLAAARLQPSAHSPLHAFSGASDAAPVDAPPALARALALLCRPHLRVALVDRTLAPALRLDVFLADEWAVALRAEDGGLRISEPLPRAAFEAQLAELLVTSGAEGTPAHAVPDAVLATLVRCVAAGVDAERAVPREELATALAELGLDAGEAEATLDALVADALLAPADGGLALGPACLPFRAVLAQRERLLLAAWPLGGPEAADAEPARKLAFAGRYGARLLIAEDVDAEEPGTLIGPVTAAEAADLVAYLLDGDGAQDGWELVAAEDAPDLLGADGRLALDGAELLALVDVLCDDGRPLPAEEPADPAHAELRAALAEGLASLAARELVAGDPPRLAGPSAAALRAWLEPELVVCLERTDAGGTRELRCSLAGGVLALDRSSGTAGGTIDVTDAAGLRAAIARFSALDTARAGGDPIAWPLEDDAEPFVQMPELVLVRAAVQRTAGVLVEGEELAFAHAGAAGCWEIDETAVEGDDEAPTGVVTFVPVDPSALIERLLAALSPRA
ncbi:MAG: hypothetical protein JSS99_10565 [Actinobacteria bacterium]|nr:hypothetical protein [Actinomycetota bacterium]